MSEAQDYFDFVSEKQERSRQMGVYQFYMMLGYKAETGGEKGYRGRRYCCRHSRHPEYYCCYNHGKESENIETDYIAGLRIKFIPSLLA